MSALDKILDVVRNYTSRDEEGGAKSRGGGILGKLNDMLGQRTRSSSRGAPRNVRPASEDPYGDPADEFRGKNVRPASQDPYGDPADERRR